MRVIDMSDKLNIYQRINKVMVDVEYIKKDKQVSGGGQNYKAVTHDQVVSAVRSSMVKHGIVIEPKQLSGEFLVMRDINAKPQPIKMGLYEGCYQIDFVNIDNPEDRTKILVNAHASDNGDKAPGKAMTYAIKTAVVKQFYFETGENDESRADIADTDFIGPRQISELEALLLDNGQPTDKLMRISKSFNFSSFSEIKSKKYPAILQAAKS